MQRTLEERKQTVDIQAEENIEVCYLLHHTCNLSGFKVKSLDPLTPCNSHEACNRPYWAKLIDWEYKRFVGKKYLEIH